VVECAIGEHLSSGHCCPQGEQWVNLRNECSVGDTQNRIIAQGEWVLIKAGRFTMGSP